MRRSSDEPAGRWVFAVCLLSLLVLTNAKEKKQPNILFIMADDLGFNDVSWNNPELVTPNMQNLVDQGVILNQTYAHSACTPSRAAYLTGYYPYRTGVQNSVVREGSRDYLPLDLDFLPQKLKEAGYSTHLVGKWHLGHCRRDVTPPARGFDTFLGLYTGYNNFFTKKIQLIGSHEDFDPNAPGTVYDFFDNYTQYPSPETEYTTHVFTDRAVQLIQEQKDKPWFIALHYTAPHWPLQVPAEYLDYYPNENNANRRTYMGMVTAMDEGIGEVIQTLEAEGVIDDTVVMFVSDNGGDTNFGASNAPLRERKTTIYEGGTRVPGFVYSPCMLQNTPRVSEDLFHMVDWFSTILDVAGVDPGNVDGISQWDMLRYGSKSPRDTFIYNIFGIHAGIRAGRYKLLEGDPEEIQARRRRSTSSSSSATESHPTPKRSCPSRRPEESDLDKMMKAFNQLTGVSNIAEARRQGGWTVDSILELMKSYGSADVTATFDCHECMLFDLLEDPTESNDLAATLPGVVLYLHELLALYKAEEVDPVLAYPYQQDPDFNPNATVVENDWCE